MLFIASVAIYIFQNNRSLHHQAIEKKPQVPLSSEHPSPFHYPQPTLTFAPDTPLTNPEGKNIHKPSSKHSRPMVPSGQRSAPGGRVHSRKSSRSGTKDGKKFAGGVMSGDLSGQAKRCEHAGFGAGTMEGLFGKYTCSCREISESRSKARHMA